MSDNQYQNPNAYMSNQRSGSQSGHFSYQVNPNWRPNVNYAAEFSKQRGQYAVKLYFPLAIIGMIVFIVRGIISLIQANNNSDCPGFSTGQYFNGVGYLLCGVFSAYAALKLKSQQFTSLKNIFYLCIAAFIIKSIGIVWVGGISDLLGTCFLAHGFKTWTWVFGFLELTYFLIVALKLNAIHQTLGKSS